MECLEDVFRGITIQTRFADPDGIMQQTHQSVIYDGSPITKAERGFPKVLFKVPKLVAIYKSKEEAITGHQRVVSLFDEGKTYDEVRNMMEGFPEKVYA